MEWGGSWRQALPGGPRGLAFLLLVGVSLVYEFWPEYRFERSLRAGLAAVSRGIVDSSRHVVRRSRREGSSHYHVVYHFPVAGRTYRNQYDCQSADLADLRAGDVLSIRYARADPNVNCPDDEYYGTTLPLILCVVGAASVLVAARGLLRIVVAPGAAPPVPQTATSLRTPDRPVEASVDRQSPRERIDNVRDVLADLDAHLQDVGQRAASGQNPAEEDLRELGFFVGKLKLLLNPDEEAHTKLLAAAEKAVAAAHDLRKDSADAFAAAGLELAGLGQVVLRKEWDAMSESSQPPPR